MTERAERFRSRQARLDSRTGHIPPPIADAELVQDVLSREIDRALVDSATLRTPVFNDEVTDEEVIRCLSDLDRAFTQQKYDELFDGVKNTLIDQLLGPFGLSRSALMETDRKFEYKDVKGEYKRGFPRTRKAIREKRANSSGAITDAYTGQEHDEGKMDMDHVISLKVAHDQGAFMLDTEEKRALGNDPDNLAPTHQSINRSKGSGALEDQPGLDRRRTKPIGKRAEKAIERRIPGGLDFVQRAARDGVQAGNQQGRQQALALLISELISSVFAEVRDVFENGWKGGDYNASWLESLRHRLNRVIDNLLNRWKDVAAAFGTGWLSGFLSAMMTALFNMFVRTSKNMVRIIREGFLSIVKAIEVLLFPPEGMNLSQAAHEATKVFTTGLVVTGGILAGEAMANSLSSMPFIDVFASVLGGLISGLGSLFIVFMLDKLDLFGVAFDERHSFIMGTLEDRISEVTRKIEDIAVESELMESDRFQAQPHTL